MKLTTEQDAALRAKQVQMLERVMQDLTWVRNRLIIGRLTKTQRRAARNRLATVGGTLTALTEWLYDDGPHFL